jgi:uncharacterized membrane protein YdbT with pleckstrin-like domain
MNPNNQQPSTPADDLQENPKNMHPMVVLQPGERVVCEVHRHPFGIVSSYVTAFAAVALTAGLAFAVVPGMISQSNADSSSLMTEIYAGVALLAVILILILGIATIVYWQNQWVVTTDSITQISQTSLFNRQVSQLSMENLEDVTVDQNGIIPHLFGFGTLKVESAGEHSKFTFPYCPRPNDYARKILDVHEKFLEERRDIRQMEGHRLNTNVIS